MTALLVSEALQILSVCPSELDGRTACLQFFCRRAIAAARRFDQPVRTKDDNHLWHSAVLSIDAVQQFCRRLTRLLSVVVCRFL